MTDSSSLRAGAAGGAAVILAALVYFNALHNPFVYDDYRTVVGNASIQRLSDVRAIVWHDVMRPLVNLSYAIDRAVWGPRPLGFHVTSVALHALNVWLLFRLALQLIPLGDGGVAAFSAAAIFGVHPVMTEAVGYISGRAEVLCATFFLLALASGRRWLRGGGAMWGAGTIALWVAALASKETAAVFPFVLAASDLLNPAGRDASGLRRRLLAIHMPLVTIAVLAGIVRLLVLSHVEFPGAAAQSRYALLDLDVIRRSAALLIVPRGQAMFHEVHGIDTVFDPRALVAIVSVGALVTLAWWCRRAEWVVSFGIAWFLLALLPASALVLFGRGEPMTEHRIYLAGCGALLAAGAGIGRLARAAAVRGPRQQWAVALAVAVVVVSFALQTLARNALWSDPIALWRESVALAPTHYRPRLLLGEALQDAGRRKEALEEFQTAIRLRPEVVDSYVQAGLCLFRMGRFDEARPYFHQALVRDPQNAAAHGGLDLLDRAGSHR